MVSKSKQDIIIGFKLRIYRNLFYFQAREKEHHPLGEGKEDRQNPKCDHRPSEPNQNSLQIHESYLKITWLTTLFIVLNFNQRI